MLKFKFVIVWLFKKFNREQLLELIDELIKILKDKNSQLKPKDAFKEKHPNYRNFYADPLEPLDAAEVYQNRPNIEYKTILANYKAEHGKELKPVNPRNKSNIVSNAIHCQHCNAPAKYIYFNDGKKRSQLKCKICNNTFTLKPRFKEKNKIKYLCPHCSKPLFLWKQRPEVSIYKCANNDCPHRIKQLKKLNDDEKKLRNERLSQFKVTYQFREYHFKPAQLSIAQPNKPKVDLSKIHNDINILSLILTLHISYAITARKTAHMLRNIFDINVSYQTVLNYAQSAAYYCHNFNQKHKGKVDDFLAGDETYVKVKKKWHYVWFFISSASHKIAAYHFSDNRGAKPAITTMLNAISTAKDKQNITFVTDGNPSYQAGLHFINALVKSISISLKSVIGLKNLDSISTTYRPYKQMVERLNRTYKYHVQSQNGFGSINGAVAKMVLFVTHYNFLRPHSSLHYKTPVELPEISNISTIQGKWAKIISMATSN
jgi:transposase-like protein